MVWGNWKERNLAAIRQKCYFKWDKAKSVRLAGKMQRYFFSKLTLKTAELLSKISKEKRFQFDKGNSWLHNRIHKLSCFPLKYAFYTVQHQKRKWFTCLQLITVIIALSNLIHCSCEFCDQIIFLSAFLHPKHVLDS